MKYQEFFLLLSDTKEKLIENVAIVKNIDTKDKL